MSSHPLFESAPMPDSGSKDPKRGRGGIWKLTAKSKFFSAEPPAAKQGMKIERNNELESPPKSTTIVISKNEMEPLDDTTLSFDLDDIDLDIDDETEPMSPTMSPEFRDEDGLDSEETFVFDDV